MENDIIDNFVLKYVIGEFKRQYLVDGSFTNYHLLTLRITKNGSKVVVQNALHFWCKKSFQNDRYFSLGVMMIGKRNGIAGLAQ